MWWQKKKKSCREPWNHKVLLLVKFIEMSLKQMHMKHVDLRITWNILVSMNGFRQITSKLQLQYFLTST